MTTSPTASATVVSTSKYTSALTPMRPTEASRPADAMPVTIVQNTTGPMSIRMSEMNPVPTGSRAAPAAGQSRPNAAPATIATSTVT